MYLLAEISCIQVIIEITCLSKSFDWYKEMKIWWHNAGHMTKMATTPVCDKNPPVTWKLVDAEN